MAKISNKMKIKNADGTFEDIQISYIGQNYTWAEGLNTTASGNQAHAEGFNTIASGNQAHAEGFNTIASGNQAHAEGHNSIASATCSHAEGGSTTASGSWSHAEGIYVTALGNRSHAEGNGYNLLPDTITTESTNDEIIAAWNTKKFTLAKGQGSHAEGGGALALGEESHAEGHNTTASGHYGHAEGGSTTASASYSHAEGSNTIASGYCQHVQGLYNIEDTENRYLHIVGNGTSSARSNAHTLDWDGDAWFAGDIKLGGTGQDDPLAISLLNKITTLELKIQQLENKLNTI